MARVEPRRAAGDPWVVRADSDAERALLDFCRAERAGELVLDGACYQVAAGAVSVPATISYGGAQRVREALEQAAASHERAARRRSSFALVDSTDD